MSSSSFDTKHEEMIHDIQMDFFGKKMATCSSDRSVKIFDTSNEEEPKLLANLKGHDGPVWQVSWAHPSFGNILASCSFDHKVIIWKETSNVWSIIKQFKHDSSVNSISWSSPDFGLCLVAASSDSSISITTSVDGVTWSTSYLKGAHKIGVNCVNFSQNEQKFVSGGGDNAVRIWTYNNAKWKEEEKLEGHTDWIRDVAWAPNVGLNYETIASCSQDRTVIIWTKEDESQWIKKQVLPKFPGTVWKLSWSVTGNILAVSGSDNAVTLWKEGEDGNFKNISTMK
eukprot:gene10535-3056_t